MFLACKVFAQIPFNTHYSSAYQETIIGKKGDNGLDSGLVSTGYFFKDSCNQNLLNQAFILNTDVHGNVQWSKKIGSQQYNYYGLSIKKSDFHNGYIVVGKTDEYQYYQGVKSGSNCSYLDPYHNAFVAFCDPNDSTRNWVYIYGNPYLDDGALEVIENQNHNFVLTGYANAKKSYYPCSENNISYTAPIGSENSEILVLEIDVLGNLLNQKSIGSLDRYMVGRSLIQESSGEYDLLCENTNGINYLSNNKKTQIVRLDMFFNQLINQTYDAFNSSIPNEVIEIDSFLLVVGETMDPSTYLPDYSYIHVINRSNLTSNRYYEIRPSATTTIPHPYIVKDIIRHDSNYSVIISGHQEDWNLNGLVSFTTEIFTNFLPTLQLNYSVSHPWQFSNTYHSNIIGVDYMDSIGFMRKRFHLFGDNEGIVSYSFLDQMMYSSCSQHAADSLFQIPVNYNSEILYEDTVSQIGFSEIIDYPIIKGDECTYLMNEPNQETNIEREKNQITESSITIFPNPTNNQFYIESDKHQINVEEIKVINSLGEEINIIASAISEYKIQVDSKLPSGLYYICINSKGERNCKKIIIK